MTRVPEDATAASTADGSLDAESARAAIQRRVRRPFTVRYVVALALIALLAVGAHLTFESLLETQSDFAREINVAGRQRMLSQRIASLSAQQQLSASPATAQQLLEAIELMRTSHAALVGGDPDLGIEGRLSPELEAQYLGPVDLDGQVLDFLDAAERSLDDPALIPTVLGLSVDGLLEDLDATVQLYEAEADAAALAAERFSVGLAVATILVLIAEGLLIFRPAVRNLSAWAVKLFDEHLQRTATTEELAELRGQVAAMRTELAALREDDPSGETVVVKVPGTR